MCTVSVLRSPRSPCGAGLTAPRWRVVFNRDEQRARPAALPPEVDTSGRVSIVSPIDPSGPGTWVAATSTGLVFALLNGPPAHAPAAVSSRGWIIPLIAGADSLDDAAARLERLRPRATQAFSLLVAGDAGVLHYAWDGCALVSHGVTTEPLVMRTCSSVDADAVHAARTEAFTRCVREGEPDTQDAFHRSVDRIQPARGVLMSRPDACTVSITTIEMFGSHVRLAYRPVSGAALRADARHGGPPSPLVGPPSTAALEVARAR